MLRRIEQTDSKYRNSLKSYNILKMGITLHNTTQHHITLHNIASRQVHYVVVTATDGGRPPLSATTTLTLLVGDVSDEPPVFPRTLLREDVAENVAIGSLVATVKAIDPDSEPKITYKLESGTPEDRLFAVHPDTGERYSNEGL